MHGILHFHTIRLKHNFYILILEYLLGYIDIQIFVSFYHIWCISMSSRNRLPQRITQVVVGFHSLHEKYCVRITPVQQITFKK